jgi:hypothetical protein
VAPLTPAPLQDRITHACTCAPWLMCTVCNLCFPSSWTFLIIIHVPGWLTRVSCKYGFRRLGSAELTSAVWSQAAAAGKAANAAGKAANAAGKAANAAGKAGNTPGQGPEGAEGGHQRSAHLLTNASHRLSLLLTTAGSACRLNPHHERSSNLQNQKLQRCWPATHPHLPHLAIRIK